MVLAVKVAIVTGGASGIGRATAFLFARQGATVVIADMSETAGQAVAQQIVENRGRAIFMRTDVTKPADCQSVVERTIGEFGKIDILFNNAGIIRRASVV